MSKLLSYKNFVNEKVGYDSRSYADKQKTALKFKDLEVEAINYINSSRTGITSEQTPVKNFYEDLTIGDILIHTKKYTFNVDVKNNSFVSLNSIFNFTGQYYMFKVNNGFYMMLKSEIKKILKSLATIDGKTIFDIRLDKKGNLVPADEELFKRFMGIKSNDVEIIIMPRSGTPGIRLNPKLFWNTLDKFLNYNK